MRRRSALALPWLAALPRLARAALSFPRDFGAHPAQRLEWWYLTGLLGEPGAAPRFGFQLTFFRLRGPAPDDHPSRLAARELLIGHAALSDLQTQRHRHDQRLARGLPGAVSADVADCAVQMRDWQLRREADDRYRARLQAREGWSLALELQPDGPPLLQGEAGHSRKGPRPEQFSRYYSRPQLAATGELRLDGRPLRVQGKAWLDHEWSDDLLGSAADADAAVGWDWLGINLHEGAALTLFQLRRTDGSQLWAGGSFRPRGQPARSFGPDEIEMHPLRRWRGYPVEWRLRCPAGEWTLKACFEAQEVDARRTTGLVYWEGAARLLEASGREAGLGYLELTGYAERMRLG